MRKIATIALLLLACCGRARAQQQFAELGDFPLQSGEVIRRCRVGYRTFGRLNADRSNAVLALTWFTGTSAQMSSLFERGALIDSTRYFVVVIDALGNGVSSSPSNSAQQPRMKFPRFTIRDMVNSQHLVLTKTLGLTHVRAVAGISMGGMQTFEWTVAYPGFMDRAISIVGSPRLDPYDLLLWQIQNDALMLDPAWKGGEYTRQPSGRLVAGISALVDSTPERFAQTHPRERLDEQMAAAARAVEVFDANDHIRQSEAMMAHDVSARFGGSLERAAAAVKARVLVVTSATDRIVTPGPAIRFAGLLHAELVRLENDCGHSGPSCDQARVKRAVSAFLAGE